jgi:RNA polymerase sigma factor (sigma-70 family)
MALMTIDDANGLSGAVASAASGDEYAFARIVAAHHDDMARVAYVVCRDIDLAQEAVQEAWSVAWRKLPKLREPDRLRPWLVAIAANEARQMMRGNRRRVVRELAFAPLGDLVLDPASLAAALDLRNALNRLSPDDRALLALRYVAGLDSTELSRAIGLSPSGTRARLGRLLSTLREELDRV